MAIVAVVGVFAPQGQIHNLVAADAGACAAANLFQADRRQACW